MRTYPINPAGLAAVVALAASSAHAGSPHEIIVEDIIGRNAVTTGGDTIRAQVPKSDVRDGVQITEQDGAMVIAGPERPDLHVIQKKMKRHGGADAFLEFLEDYPAVEITAPKGAALKVSYSAASIDAGDLGGAFVVQKSMLEGAVGDVAAADVTLTGWGDLSLGDVSGPAKLSVYGSGDIQMGSSRELVAKVSGSGDIDIDRVDGAAVVSIKGSGDIQLDDVAGDIEAKISGSGDIQGGAVRGGGVFVIAGSGDIVVDSVNGPTIASIKGSGDIDIDDGRAENLRVSVAGSGSFVFSGVATNLDASVGGSGEINVARNEGALHTKGDGEIIVAGRNYSKR